MAGSLRLRLGFKFLTMGLFKIRGRSLSAALFFALLGVAQLAFAIDAATVQGLALDDTSAKLERLEALSLSADTSAIPVLEALFEGNLYLADGTRPVIVSATATIDALSMKAIEPAPQNVEKVSINNRVRRQLETTIAALKLVSPDTAVRLKAAQQLAGQAEPEMLPLIERALNAERDKQVRDVLLFAQGSVNIKSEDPLLRLAAIDGLAKNSSEATRNLLAGLIEKDAAGQYAEPDPRVRAAAAKAFSSIENRVKLREYVGHAFGGLSLGSILLLAALGLAITFGLMGIINMAHGELLMIGAYATFVVQSLFAKYLPAYFDWYLLAAVPVAFLAAALVGMAIERSVIRYLYGRPLETLLATWGVSLILIQIVRALFGAQNVEVRNPNWMSGGAEVLGGLVLPYNRIAIIAFSAIVVLLTWALLNRTRLGLFVRAVTQNRAMASCTGIPTKRVDLLAFALGSGIAGLGGCALSQVTNVGPELGQNYIVDSFMVVVLGGVGQLAGTIYAAFGLGEINKFLEPYAGAVMAKIFVLVFIIMFIQRRPQGLFALRGRTADA